MLKAWHNYRVIRQSFGPRGWRGHIQSAWVSALGNRYWAPPPFGEWHCVVCGRRLNLLFDFVKLVDIMGKVRKIEEGYEWHNEDYGLVDKASLPSGYFRCVCLDHYNLTGSPIWDIRTGLAVNIPYQRSRLYYALRNLGQGILLRGVMAVRFVWFLLRGFAGWNLIGPIKFILCTKAGT